MSGPRLTTRPSTPHRATRGCVVPLIEPSGGPVAAGLRDRCFTGAALCVAGAFLRSPALQGRHWLVA